MSASTSRMPADSKSAFWRPKSASISPRPAARPLAGTLAQTGTGLFGVEVGGLTPASEHDQLNITGTARLNGTLEVELIDGFLPEIGDEVIVMLAGSVINTFDTVTAFDGGGMFGVDVSVLYSATDVTVRFDDVFLLGDYNRNGVVEAADYVVWRKTLGQMGMDLLADGNVNNEIDAGDYEVWHARFGQTLPGSGAAASANATVPEPASSVLLMIAASGLVAGDDASWQCDRCTPCSLTVNGSGSKSITC